MNDKNIANRNEFESYKIEIKRIIEEFINENKLVEAKGLIQEYESIEKNDIDLYSFKGIIEIMENNLDMAEQIFKEGLLIKDDNFDLNYNLGYLYQNKNIIDKSKIYYKRALFNIKDKNIQSLIFENLKVMGETEDLEDILRKPKFLKTSIIILTYNNFEYTRLCIESIRKYTEEGSYEIIVIDNNSTDETIEWIKNQKDLKVILNSENLGFPKGCNQGIKIAEGESILLLNNDVIVTPNWLTNLNSALWSSENVGAVGAVTNNCSYYQSIYTEYKSIEEMIEFAKDFNVSNPLKWEKRIKLVGFCMLIKKSIIKDIGLLDERFTPGNFEDDDYSIRIINEGYNLLLCNDTFIHHFGSTSFKDINNFNSILYKNSKKFEEKWGFNSSYSSFIRNDIIKYIDKRSEEDFNILEVGCACGATLLKIKNLYKNANLYGIELNENAALISKNFADIRAENIESASLSYEENYFDYIIFADVLEHLYDPWLVLKNIKRYLKDNGKIIASIPNVMHYSVIRDLINGNWTYRESGILDKTHMRFFTFNEIVDMFNRCGYFTIAHQKTTVNVSKEDKEFMNKLAEISSEEMLQQYDAYQYLIVAERLNKITNKENKEYNVNVVNRNKSDKDIEDNCSKENKCNYFIDPSCDVRGIEKIKFDNNVVIQKDCWINIAYINTEQYMIEFGEGSNIGRRSTISASNKIIFGKNVLLGPNVLISDHNHEYRDTNIPIIYQGIDSMKNCINIGDETWIGANSVIIGNVKIGKHCVIGSNSVVTKDIPDYCVAVGNPAKVIKTFDTETDTWKRVSNSRELDMILSQRYDLSN
ncbi:glycosyltransferase [Clostridium intestinale]|uniref:glycosyltransferase n=1 Tax=Clostridium intestinale TaxID=36845 RepID=UPI002DD652FF|nr:glycosyltransferase [Clostridium intestinale]WRY53845.1 glycosyltransferase [Clostridium intestinale]